MGFLDKAKAMADQAMSSLDQTVSPEGENDRRGEQLFRDLGALTWAQHRGSATQATADEIQAVLEELAEVDPTRSLTVGRNHVHSGGTAAATGGTLTVNDRVGLSGLQARYDEQLRGAPLVRVDLVPRPAASPAPSASPAPPLSSSSCSASSRRSARPRRR